MNAGIKLADFMDNPISYINFNLEHLQIPENSAFEAYFNCAVKVQ